MLNKLSIFLKYYLPAIVWAGTIFYFSSRPGLRYFPENVKEIILRKGAHFVEFAFLSLLLWRIFYIAHKLSAKKSFFLALVLSVFYGASDELHQTFVSGREGKIIDAAFDALSSLFILEIIFYYVRKRIKWRNVLIIFLTVAALFGLEFGMIREARIAKENLETEQSALIQEESKNTKTVGNSIEEEKTESIIEEKIPNKFFISVPFTSQAPYKIWDEIHEDACEEASGIMLAFYLLGKKLTPEIAEKEIQDLIKFENKKFGDYKDTTTEQTAEVISEFYELDKINKKLKVVYDFKKEDLKKYLIKGNPIIIPAAGRKLGNPNFKTPGPLYHNLVLVGFNGDTIITNDPGTRKGEGYKYDIDILYSAIHDFPGRPEDIEKGRKAMIVVE